MRRWATRQKEERLRAGERWQGTDYVFTSTVGGAIGLLWRADGGCDRIGAVFYQMREAVGMAKNVARDRAGR